MGWSRRRIGSVAKDSLVHALYEWSKERYIYWDTQCMLQWGERTNRVRMRRPKMTVKTLTCLLCVDYETRRFSR